MTSKPTDPSRNVAAPRKPHLQRRAVRVAYSPNRVSGQWAAHDRYIARGSATKEASDQEAGFPHFRLYDMRSTYATRLSAGGVADEWVTQMLRHTDAKVFKKYSQMKLQMKREALTRINRQAGDAGSSKHFDTVDDE